jgi:tRNA G18 (ribose-2'-O)-methylase SpoU
MPFVRIDAADDPRVADYQGASEPALVRSRGLFIAEGRLVVARIIGDGRHGVRSLLLNEAALRALQPALELLVPTVPIFVCRAAQLAHLTGVDFHRGCLALVERPPATPLTDLLRGTHTLVVLEGVANPDNVGGVFRNAAAFGVDAVILSSTCCDPLYRKAVRTSMGATLRVPFARVDAWADALEEIRASHFTIVALTPRCGSETIDAFLSRGRPERVALLVGAEGTGLTSGAEAAADHRVRIPIRAEIDSLNLAVATGIALSRLSTTVVSDQEARNPEP